MIPRGAIDYCSNVAHRYAVFLSEFRNRGSAFNAPFSSVTEGSSFWDNLSNPINVFIAKFARWMPLSFGTVRPTSHSLFGCIFLIGSKVKMFRVYASRSIATMQNTQAFRDFSVMDFPRYSMCGTIANALAALIRVMDISVSVFIMSPSPKPASSSWFWGELSPESFMRSSFSHPSILLPPYVNGGY